MPLPGYIRPWVHGVHVTQGCNYYANHVCVRTANISALSKLRLSAELSAVRYTNLNGVVSNIYIHVWTQMSLLDLYFVCREKYKTEQNHSHG